MAAELGVKPLGDSELVQALKVLGFPGWEMAGKWEMRARNGENGEHFMKKLTLILVEL